MYQHKPFNKNKISSEFANRLNNLQPQQKVRVIVLLKFENRGKKSGCHQSLIERQATMEAIRNSAKQALSYIRKIIQDFGGKQLADSPNVLGQIPVEISAAGVNALAESEAVKGVMEDQPIYLGDGSDGYC